VLNGGACLAGATAGLTRCTLLGVLRGPDGVLRGYALAVPGAICRVMRCVLIGVFGAPVGNTRDHPLTVLGVIGGAPFGFPLTVLGVMSAPWRGRFSSNPVVGPVRALVRSIITA
jgi:hypothetical protein